MLEGELAATAKKGLAYRGTAPRKRLNIIYLINHEGKVRFLLDHCDRWYNPKPRVMFELNDMFGNGMAIVDWADAT